MVPFLQSNFLIIMEILSHEENMAAIYGISDAICGFIIDDRKKQNK